MDREHERDFFQQEIQKLEQQLKNPQKLQTGSEQRNQEVTGERLFFALPQRVALVDVEVTQRNNRAGRVTWAAL